MNSLQSGGPGFKREFTHGEDRYTILGIVSGSLNSFTCGGELPDYYTYVGSQEILGWIGVTFEAAKNKLSKFNFIEDSIRCKGEEDCPQSNFCSEGFCFKRSTVSSTGSRQGPNPACPEDTPCKGRGEEECRKAKCNRYGDSCWCETRPSGDGSDIENVEEVEVEENEEYDFVEGKPEEWEIACDTADDCPHLWYCAEKVCLEANLKTYHSIEEPLSPHVSLFSCVFRGPLSPLLHGKASLYLTQADKGKQICITFFTIWI